MVYQKGPSIELTGAKRREWMGTGVAGIVIHSYGLDHSLIPYV